MKFLSKISGYFKDGFGVVKRLFPWIQERDNIRREKIDRWRKMTFELRKKSKEGSSEDLKIRLDNHPDYRSLYRHLNKQTQEKIKEYRYVNQDIKIDTILTLIYEDIDNLEAKWKL